MSMPAKSQGCAAIIQGSRGTHAKTTFAGHLHGWIAAGSSAHGYGFLICSDGTTYSFRLVRLTGTTFPCGCRRSVSSTCQKETSHYFYSLFSGRDNVDALCCFDPLLRDSYCGFLRYQCRIVGKQHTHIFILLRAVGLTAEEDASDRLGPASSFIRATCSCR